MSTLRPIALLLALAAPAAADAPRWKKVDINPRSVFEGAGAFDVDGDGKLDVVSGETWYKGPDYKQAFPVRKVGQTGTYRNCFSTCPLDVDGDGDLDFITCSYFDKNVGWVENPGKAGSAWTYHEVDLPGPSEAAVMVDLTGDGKPEFLPNAVNVVVFYELEVAGTTPKWKKYDLGTKAAGHGVGTGDVNGDGRVDLLTPKGWFEAPAKPSTEPWPWHGEWELGATGIQTTAKDVDGDSLADIVYGMGHGRGLYWVKQMLGPDGKRLWSKPAVIDPTLSSVHTQVWADLDGDGRAEELLTGKRVYAHEIEPGDVEASQVAYYKFDKAAKDWKKFPIYLGEPAASAPKEGNKRDAQKDFAPGTAGTGLEMTVVDIDGDGDLDIVCPGKSGLYLFQNLGTTKP